MTKVALSYGKY